jgi:hypothetical protein
MDFRKHLEDSAQQHRGMAISLLTVRAACRKRA